MKRPCSCDSAHAGEPYSRRRDCRHCWLYFNDPRYKKLWNEPADAPGTVQPRRSIVLVGPGAELSKIFAELGVVEWKGCGCSQKIAQMNAWGVAGCEEHFEEIRGWLVEARDKISPAAVLGAIAAGLASGVAWKINPLDIPGSLVRLAIDRAKVK